MFVRAVELANLTRRDKAALRRVDLLERLRHNKGKSNQKPTKTFGPDHNFKRTNSEKIRSVQNTSGLITGCGSTCTGRPRHGECRLKRGPAGSSPGSHLPDERLATLAHLPDDAAQELAVVEVARPVHVQQLPDVIQMLQ